MAEHQVSIPDDLYKHMESKLKQLPFKTVDEYVTSILRQTLKDKENQPVFTKEDEEKIQKRLRDLGYID